MVTHKSLPFCRADLMDDPRELLTPDDVRDRPYVTKLKQMLDDSVRRQVFVSSWHVSKHNTATMWKAYEGSVALVSTVGRLVDVLIAHRRICDMGGSAITASCWGAAITTQTS